MVNGLETQLVQAAGGMLALAVTTALGYLTNRAKEWLASHTSAKTAAMSSVVIDNLSKIADSVVQDFNQRIVNDAKKNGVWTPELAANIKNAAVQAVLDQGSQLVALGYKVVGNVPALVETLIEEAVARYHVPAPTVTNVATTPVQPVA